MASQRNAAAELVRQIQDFDRQYLRYDPATGKHSYPPNLVPFINDLKKKLVEYDTLLSNVQRQPHYGSPALGNLEEENPNQSIYLAPGSHVYLIPRAPAGAHIPNNKGSLEAQLADVTAERDSLAKRLSHAADHYRTKTVPLTQQLQHSVQQNEAKDKQIAELQRLVTSLTAALEEVQHQPSMPTFVPMPAQPPVVVKEEVKVPVPVHVSVPREITEEEVDELEDLRLQVEDGQTMISELQHKLYREQVAAQRARHDLDSFKRNIDKDKSSLLTQIAELEEMNRTYIDSLALANFQAQTSEEDLSDREKLLRKTSKENAARMQTLQEQGQLLARIQQQLAATHARVGREKLRMACARYLSVWYRDRSRQGDAARDEAAQLRRRVQEGKVNFLSNNPELENQLEEAENALRTLRGLVVKANAETEAEKEKVALLETMRVKDAEEMKALKEDLRKARDALQMAERNLAESLSGLGTSSQAGILAAAAEDSVLKRAQQQLALASLDSYHGDYAGVRNNSKVLTFLYAKGDHEVAFADHVTVITPKNKYLKRLLVISNQAIYIFESNLSSSKALAAYVPMSCVSHVTMSRFAADVFAVHHRSRLDLLFMTPKRMEIIFVLMLNHLRLARTALSVVCAERLYISDNERRCRELLVVDSQEVRLTESMPTLFSS